MSVNNPAAASVSVYDGAQTKYTPPRGTGAVSWTWIGPSTVDPSNTANVVGGTNAAQDNDTWVQTS